MINVAELLKDCPTGMELDCTMYDNVRLDYIREINSNYPIRLITPDGELGLNKYGCYSNNKDAKCVIFPKGKITWEGFQRPFKSGDVVVSSMGNLVLISHINDKQIVYYHCILEPFGYFRILKTPDCGVGEVSNCYLASDKQRERLFDKIKIVGYQYNQSTNKLEKLIIPKFKVGDIIQDKTGYKVKITEVNIEDECYGYESLIINGLGSISFVRQDDWELVPNKFDITTLKPFKSKVLVRDYDNRIWIPTFWGKYLEDDSTCPYLTTNGCYKYCIPYKGNEHLLGTINDCDEYYKTWK